MPETEFELGTPDLRADKLSPFAPLKIDFEPPDPK